MVTIVRRTSPLGEFVSLRQAMDRLFEDSFVGTRGWLTDGVGSVPMNVTNHADELEIQASLPGFRPEDVEITIEDGTLTIRGETRSEQSTTEGEALVSEIRSGSVMRTLSLPAGLEPDQASATFENGILNLRIPKAEAVKPHQIRITPTVEGQRKQVSDVAASGDRTKTTTQDKA